MLDRSQVQWKEFQHLIEHLPMLRSDANFSLKKGSFANACTNGAILMASGRVPNTVSTFTSILFE